ncbi:hypothetical protein N9X20_02080 [Opitutales bacterium]|nr:hypothetical protein [Opitutales bacterium]MDB2682561.1 hypothetical protein [Opitutales bacterium]
MNEDLEQAWKQSLAPFDTSYKTLSLSDPADIEPARCLLLSIAKHIKMYFPNEKLLSLQDWHFHDGFVTDAKQVIELEKLFETDSSFRETSTGDDLVYVLVYPHSKEFILRWCIEEDENNELKVDIDFTGLGVDIMEIRKRMNDFNLPKAEEIDAKTYFTQNYAG